MLHPTSQQLNSGEEPCLGRLVNSLIARLTCEDGVERQIARQRLVSIGEPAVPSLIRCLSDPRRQARWEAAKALRGIRDPISATALVNALEDKDFGVRWVAAAGLSALGRDALWPLLSALLERPDSDELRHGVHHVCHDLVQTEVGPIVRPVLKALNQLEPEIAVPQAAYDALNRLRGPRVRTAARGAS
jgi:HEAT repeat protein